MKNLGEIKLTILKEDIGPDFSIVVDSRFDLPTTIIGMQRALELLKADEIVESIPIQQHLTS